MIRWNVLRWGAATIICAIVAFLVNIQAAKAEDPTDPQSAGNWHVAANAETNFPLDVGLRVQAETPFRLRLATSFGILPEPYVDILNAFLVGVNAYDQTTADLVKSALKASLVWRTHVGYRPFADRGFYAEAGYGLVTLGGGASGAQLIAGVTGYPAPASQGKVQFGIQSTLHMANVELGWEWTWLEHFHVRAAVGGAFTFAANTAIHNDANLNGKAMKSFEVNSAAYLDDLYRTYVFTPVVTFGMGGQFL